MRFSNLYPIVLLVLAHGAFSAEGHLTVTPPSQEMKPTIDETVGTYVFRVTNITKTPIAISDFKGGCGCITHTASQTTLEPGQNAEISITFDFKDFVGPQKRSLYLFTKAVNGGEPVKTTFQLTGDIPTAITFSKKATIWTYGEEVKASKTIDVSVKPGFDVVDLKVENVELNKFIAMEQTLNAERKVLSISVKPTSTDINVVSPSAKSNVQVPYIVSYKTKAGTAKYERFWVLIAKRPNSEAPK